MPKIVVYLFVLILFLFFHLPAFADSNVLINEFLANSISGEGEWVEFYFPDGSFDISSYHLKENSGKRKTLENLEKCGNYAIFNLVSSSGNPIDGWLHNSDQESIFLYDGNNDLIDSFEDWSSPDEGKTLGRIPDGSSNWQETERATRCQQNSQALPTPTSTSQSSTSQSPTSTSTKSKSPSPSPKNSPSPASSKKTTSVLGSSQSAEITASSAAGISLSVSPTPSAEPKADKSSNKIKIAGAVAGSGAIVMGLSAGLYLWYRRRITKNNSDKESI